MPGTSLQLAAQPAGQRGSADYLNGNTTWPQEAVPTHIAPPLPGEGTSSMSTAAPTKQDSIGWDSTKIMETISQAAGSSLVPMSPARCQLRPLSCMPTCFQASRFCSSVSNSEPSRSGAGAAEACRQQCQAGDQKGGIVEHSLACQEAGAGGRQGLKAAEHQWEGAKLLAAGPLFCVFCGAGAGSPWLPVIRAWGQGKPAR